MALLEAGQEEEAMHVLVRMQSSLLDRDNQTSSLLEKRALPTSRPAPYQRGTAAVSNNWHPGRSGSHCYGGRVLIAAK